MRNDVRVVLELSLRELDTLVDAKTNEGVRAAATELRALEVAGALHCDLKYANGRVDRLSRQHLLQVQSEDVGNVHHGPENAVDGIANEGGQSRNLTFRQSQRLEDC